MARKIDEFNEELRNVGRNDGITKPQAYSAISRNKWPLTFVAVVAIIVAYVVFH